MANPNTQFQAQLAAFDQQSNAYIDQLLGQAGGDRDLAIRMLTRDHDLAVGSNDAQTAQFLERVSDSLEQRIGRIPYDYEIATQRTNQDLSRTTELTNRNKELALKRLAEDEQTWKQDFANTARDTRQTQNEELSRRGLLTGTREGAQGVAARDIGRVEGDLTSTLSAYDRALGRTSSDISTQASDVLTEAKTAAERQLADLKTGARRGVIDTQDTFSFGKEAQQRQYEARQKELERQRKLMGLSNLTYATTGI